MFKNKTCTHSKGMSNLNSQKETDSIISYILIYTSVQESTLDSGQETRACQAPGRTLPLISATARAAWGQPKSSVGPAVAGREETPAPCGWSACPPPENRPSSAAAAGPSSAGPSPADAKTATAVAFAYKVRCAACPPTHPRGSTFFGFRRMSDAFMCCALAWSCHSIVARSVPV